MLGIAFVSLRLELEICDELKHSEKAEVKSSSYIALIRADFMKYSESKEGHSVEAWHLQVSVVAKHSAQAIAWNWDSF